MAQGNARIVMESRDIRIVLERLADEIITSTNDHAKLALVGIHTGGVFLARRLESIISKKLGIPIPVGTLDITLYRDDLALANKQPVVRETQIDFDLSDIRQTPVFYLENSSDGIRLGNVIKKFPVNGLHLAGRCLKPDILSHPVADIIYAADPRQTQRQPLRDMIIRVARVDPLKIADHPDEAVVIFELDKIEFITELAQNLLLHFGVISETAPAARLE